VKLASGVFGRSAIVLLDHGECTSSALDASAPVRARGHKTRADVDVDAELEVVLVLELDVEAAVGEGRLADDIDAECTTGLDTVARHVGEVMSWRKQRYGWDGLRESSRAGHSV